MLVPLGFLEQVIFSQEKYIEHQVKKADELFEKEKAFNYEVYLIRKDKKIIPVEATISLLKDPQGVRRGSIAICRDVSERKLTEKELRTSEERLKILFEFAPDAYYLSDVKGTFIDGNRAAEKLIGYHKENLIGKNFLKLNLLSPLQIPKAVRLLAKNALGHPTGPDEFILGQKDGRHVVTEISNFPVKIKGQSMVLGIARDTTEHQKIEKALKKAHDELFAHSFSHLHPKITIHGASDY